MTLGDGKMKVLVTGASGYIGRKFAEYICREPWVEKVIGIDVKETTFAHPLFSFYKRDIREAMDDIFLKEKIDTVVHTAYVLPPIHDTELMESINVGGTRNILNLSARHRVKQVLYTSSTTAYGFHPDNDTPLIESSPLRGNDDFTYAKNKKEIESVVESFAKDNPEILISVVRPCFVVGPGFANPLASHLRKKLVMLPSKTLPWQFVHEDDVINVMALLLNKRISGIYNVAGEGTMTFAEMVKKLGNIMVPIPWTVIFLLNNLAWFLRLRFITEFPSSSMHMMVNPWISSSKKLISSTGYRFRYDTRQAFDAFVNSVRK